MVVLLPAVVTFITGLFFGAVITIKVMNRVTVCAGNREDDEACIECLPRTWH